MVGPSSSGTTTRRPRAGPDQPGRGKTKVGPETGRPVGTGTPSGSLSRGSFYGNFHPTVGKEMTHTREPV